MNFLHYINVVSAIEVCDEEEMGATIEERLAVKTLAAVLIYFEDNIRSHYMETMNALHGM